MKILVDTCIWSLALRRKTQPNVRVEILELQELIKEVRVQLIGPIRQEILSGIKSKSQFTELKTKLAAFSDLPLSPEDFELAAEYYNFLRTKGIQGSNTDFLICAVSTRHHLPVFTTDNDFIYFGKHIPITLHMPRVFDKK
jgi:predicted nucleic acid-binding protein